MQLFAKKKAPQAIGHYDLLGKIAEGGMGSVHKGRDQTTGELVAVKLIHPKKMSSTTSLQRFEQEFRAAAQLDHPNIVRGLDFGCEDSQHYLVMEYVDGPSLGDLIEKKARIPEEEAVGIIVQVAEALEHAHQQGIIHRDIKPDNILLTSENRAKLTDFGLVKHLEGGADLTRTNIGLGTPNFMAPEQFDDAKHVDLRCDVYSLGATLYMAITGELPFRARTALHTLNMKIRNECTPPAQLVAGLSERVDQAICRSMMVDPRERPGTCKEFIRLLLGRKGSKGAMKRLKSPPVPSPSVLAAYSGNERRATVRFSSKQEGACFPLSVEDDERWSAKVHDISSTGIGLLLPRRFEKDTVLFVQLSHPESKYPHWLLVRVMRTERHKHKKWLHGCSFARNLSDEEVEVLR